MKSRFGYEHSRKQNVPNGRKRRKKHRRKSGARGAARVALRKEERMLADVTQQLLVQRRFCTQVLSYVCLMQHNVACRI